MRFDRRDFLKGALGTAAAVTLSGGAQAAECDFAGSSARSFEAIQTRQGDFKGERFEFYPIEKSHLDFLAIIPQCLDNQWVPTSLLQKIIRSGKSRLDHLDELQDHIRSEYIRGLVNGEQVVVNRAYFQNNPQIYRDFRNVDKLELETFDDNRESFKRLLRAGAIVPYLFNEDTPIGQQGFTAIDEGSEAWGAVCRETAPKCLRLSWDDLENKRATRRMQFAFASFANSLSMTGNNLLQKIRLLQNAPTELTERRDFRERLKRLADVAQDISAKAEEPEADGLPSTFITRENIYKDFVVSDGSPVPVGAYDKSKPFAAEVKLIIDLKYNANLSDALERNILTPMDTPSRSLFLDLEFQKAKQNATADATSFLDTAKAIRQQIFALTQSSLTFEAFKDFDIRTVERVRNAPEWRSYIDTVKRLMCNPAAYGQGGVVDVYNAYVEMLKVAARFHHERQVQVTTKLWNPRIELTVDLGIAAVSLVLAQSGGPILYRVLKAVGGVAAGRAVSTVFSMATSNVVGSKVEKQLANSVDFMRTRLADPEKQLKDIEDMLRLDSNFSEMGGAKEPKEATLNEPVEL